MQEEGRGKGCKDGLREWRIEGGWDMSYITCHYWNRVHTPLLMYSISVALMDPNTADIFIHQSRCGSEKHKGVVISLYSNNLGV